MTGYDGDRGRAHAQTYESVPADELLGWLDGLLPDKPGSVLDIGAGSGRDAAWYAQRGHAVVAVEPSATMREEGRRRHPDPGITWIDDHLPALARVLQTGAAFDVVHLSAVWMHVAPTDRLRAFRKTVSVLKPGGLLVMTLRLGPPDAARNMHAVDTGEIERLARAHGLAIVRQDVVPDRLGRPEITWVHFALRLPDDGTGALPLLRHVILNDAKTSTYKLGLLRAVARAADSAGGLARMDDDRVSVPLGLIGLFWIRLYKPLIAADLPQAPTHRGRRGLGFLKASWDEIDPLDAPDLRVGGRFDTTTGAALHGALRDAIDTIVKNPAHFMTLPGSADPVFPVTKARTRTPKGPLILDPDYLWSFGALHMPLHLWQSLARFDAWIEPALVAEWSRLIGTYAEGHGRAIDTGAISRAMTWHDPARDVRIARAIASEMQTERTLYCVWTGKRLSSSFDIDHCIPFAAWPCDDLWNLMPASGPVNRRKRDKLPSATAIDESTDRILSWWESAYVARDAYSRRFSLEAGASLPIAADPDADLPTILDGLRARRLTIRTNHAIAEWTP